MTPLPMTHCRVWGWWVPYPLLSATTFTYAATPTSDTYFHAITTPPFSSPISWTHACTGLAGSAGLAVGHGRLRRLVFDRTREVLERGIGTFPIPLTSRMFLRQTLTSDFSFLNTGMGRSSTL